MLGPLAQNDMRARHSSRTACYAQIGAEASKELWHTEQRGGYTRLLSEASAMLRERDEEHCTDFPPSPEMSRGQKIQTPLSEGILYDVCELFRGSGVETGRCATQKPAFPAMMASTLMVAE